MQPSQQTDYQGRPYDTRQTDYQGRPYDAKETDPLSTPPVISVEVQQARTGGPLSGPCSGLVWRGISGRCSVRQVKFSEAVLRPLSRCVLRCLRA